MFVKFQVCWIPSLSNSKFIKFWVCRIPNSMFVKFQICWILSLSNSEFVEFLICWIMSLLNYEFVKFLIWWIMSLLNSEFVEFWVCQILSSSNSEFVKFWIYQILTLSNSEFIKFFFLSLLKYYDILRRWSSHCSILIPPPWPAKPAKETIWAKLQYLQLVGLKFQNHLMFLTFLKTQISPVYSTHFMIYWLQATNVSRQGILKGEVSLYHRPPVWNQLYDNWQFLFLFAKQTKPNQSNRRSTVQWYFPL